MTQSVYTVKQVNAYIKNMFSQDYMLSRIYVKGEVSNCKYHSSGHIYFSLKDSSGTIACVMFAGNRTGLSFRMEEGQQIVVFGNVDVYERDGRYQLYAREIRLDGEGRLYERFQALKKDLEEMGMFDPSYKLPIPKYAGRIGVVTASTGAAVQDIMNITKRRNPYVQLILYPAQVQGEGAAKSIVNGIHALEQKNVDVMIVGRGGGSIEDLWAFNEEPVARAIFECKIPIISAVGHETDTTIADFVSDLRAPTPSAAAELAVFSYTDFVQSLRQKRVRMDHAMTMKTQMAKKNLQERKLKLLLLHPRHKLQQQRQRCVDLEQTIRHLMEQKLQIKKQEMALRIERLKGLSPLEKLSKGYAFVQDEENHVLRSVNQTQIGSCLSVQLTDGSLRARVEEVDKEKHYE